MNYDLRRLCIWTITFVLVSAGICSLALQLCCFTSFMHPTTCVTCSTFTMLSCSNCCSCCIRLQPKLVRFNRIFMCLPPLVNYEDIEMLSRVSRQTHGFRLSIYPDTPKISKATNWILCRDQGREIYSLVVIINSNSPNILLFEVTSIIALRLKRYRICSSFFVHKMTEK